MNEKFKREYLKFTGKKYEASFRDFIRIWSSHTMKFLYYGRLSEFAKSPILKKYYLFRSKLIGRKNGNEIPTFMNIGAGLMLCHGYGVTVNENAILGDDVTLFKGCTVGGEKRQASGYSYYWEQSSSMREFHCCREGYNRR